MQSFRQRLDGFVNVLTGLGGRRDKRLSAQFLPSLTLDDQTLENLYNDSDLAYTIVSIFPESALRQGWETTIGDDTEGTREAELRGLMEELGVSEKVLEAASWGRLYGGGAIFLGVDQGNPGRPLDDEKGGEVRFLTVFDKTELQPATWYTDPLAPKFGEPETYRLTPSATRGDGVKATGQLVHESRLVLFGGAHTTRRRKQQNNGWDNSVLQRVYESIRDFESGFHGASFLLQDAGQAVYGVKNLLELLAANGGQEALQKRFEMIELSRSVAHALLIDTEETFERKTTSFTGIPDVLDRLCNRLSAATGIPVSVLMGQAPAGLNATGASDVRMFYDRIKSYQDQVIGPAIERITKLVLISQGGEPESWSIKFNSLYQPTDLETAQLRKTVCDTDVAYINSGVVTPEEVGMSRFTPDGWSMETQIDLDLRSEIDQANAEKAIAAANDPQIPLGETTKPEPPANKFDAFDPDQPRDESGRWGGAGQSPKMKAAVAAYHAAKQAKQKPTAAVTQDLNSPGRLADTSAIELGAETEPATPEYSELAYISDVYDTAVSKGFKGTLDDFKSKLPASATKRVNIVSAFDRAKLQKSETHTKVGNTSVERHFVLRKDGVEIPGDSGSDDFGKDTESDDEPGTGGS